MKKLISLLLVLALCTMMIPAMAEEDLSGEWYASFAGVAMTMTLNADGTASMIAPGQEGEATGTWTQEGDQVTITINDSPATGTVTEEGILLSEGGMELVFTREPVAMLVMADIKADAAEEEFYGEWTLAYLESDGVIVDPSAVGMVLPNVRLGEGTVEFIATSENDIFAAVFSLMGLVSSYEDGKLVLTAAAEGANGSGTVEMLEDGMIKVVMINASNDEMILYGAPAEVAEEPAA